jgi:ubiquinone biosynthesis protein COQ9
LLLIPNAYINYANVFLKEALNMLPPHRLYNHKIILEAKNNLGYSPLYKIIAKELEITKQYLVNNLNKGFIAPS